MAQKINITCYGCKEDFTTEPYYRNTEIQARSDPYSGIRYYVARTIAMAICTHCGEINGHACEKEISEQDILNLAIKEYKRD